MSARPERRTHRGLEKYLIEPVYFWLDLYGPDGRPSHHKVLTAWGFFFALAGEVWMLRNTENISDVNWPYVGLVIATLALAMGKDVFKAVLKMKGNGNGRSEEATRGGG